MKIVRLIIGLVALCSTIASAVIDPTPFLDERIIKDFPKVKEANEKNETVKWYHILDCDEKASDSQKKKAYWRLAKKVHPDKHKDDETYVNAFKQLGIAFDKDKKQGTSEPTSANYSYSFNNDTKEFKCNDEPLSHATFYDFMGDGKYFTHNNIKMVSKYGKATNITLGSIAGIGIVWQLLQKNRTFKEKWKKLLQNNNFNKKIENVSSQFTKKHPMVSKITGHSGRFVWHSSKTLLGFGLCIIGLPTAFISWMVSTSLPQSHIFEKILESLLQKTKETQNNTEYYIFKTHGQRPVAYMTVGEYNSQLNQIHAIPRQIIILGLLTTLVGGTIANSGIDGLQQLFGSEHQGDKFLIKE